MDARLAAGGAVAARQIALTTLLEVLDQACPCFPGLSTARSWRPTKGTDAHGRFHELPSLLYPASKSTSFSPLPCRRLFLRPSTPTNSCKRQDVGMFNASLYFPPHLFPTVPAVARPCPPASGPVSPAFHLSTLPVHPLYHYIVLPGRRASRADLHDVHS